jgi:hypothetical protein
MTAKNKAAVALGRLGGSVRSVRKSLAAIARNERYWAAVRAGTIKRRGWRAK